MGLDPGIGTNVDRSGFECTLHDTEALLDLPALMVCVCNFTRFFICKIGGYGVESVKAFFLTNVFITNALYFLFSNFPVFRTTLRFDQTPKIVGVFLCMHLSVLQCLFGPHNLFFPYFAKIVPILDGVGDNEPLVKIFVIDRKFFVKDRIFVYFSVKLVEIVFAVFGFRSHLVPTVRRERSLLQVGFQLF